MVDDTGNLNGGTKTAAKNGQLGRSPLTASPSASYLQPHCPAHLRHRSIAHHDERRVLVACEADKAERHLTRERRRAVENHEREGTTAQQHVGAPSTACGIARTHHTEERAIERRPVGGIEGTGCIDARDTLPPGQCCANERANQRRLARAERADEFGESPAREPSAQRVIEFLEAGGEGVGHHQWRSDDLLELGAKLG